jgi:hypothetical protein
MKHTTLCSERLNHFENEAQKAIIILKWILEKEAL